MAEKVKKPLPPPVPLELWRELYDAASKFQMLAPWNWMSDNFILGINNVYGVRLLCVMGEMGQVFGVVGYRGQTGIRYLLELLTGDLDPESSDALLLQDALLVDFVPKTHLQKEDVALIKKLGFKPAAGRPARYPEFQSHKPGYMPWFLNEEEARAVLDNLVKVTMFAEMMRDHPDLFDSHPPGEFPFFPDSTPERLSLDQLEWRRVVAPPRPVDPPIVPNVLETAPLSKLPKAKSAAVELFVFHTSMQIADGPRPYYLKMALAVDSGTGHVLGFETGSPQQTAAELARLCLLKSVKSIKARPRTVKVNSAELGQALKPLTTAVKIELQVVEFLPMAEMARESLAQFGNDLPA